MKISKLKIDKKSRQARLLLSGILNIQNAAVLKENFNEAVNKAETLIVDLSEIEECDFTCLQMIQALFAKAEVLNVRLNLVYPAGGEFERLAADAGFSNLEKFKNLRYGEEVLCQK